MSDSSQTPWSNNPFAPQIPYSVYFAEKANFAGSLIGAIFYGTLAYTPVNVHVHRPIIPGIVIAMFFQCMGALFNPVNHKNGGIKWPLVAHTVAMFSLATVYTGMILDVLSVAYIDNRAFPGVGDMIPPGPLGYQLLIFSDAINLVPNLVVILNSWLADGLLVSSVRIQSPKCLTRIYSSSIVATLFMPKISGSSAFLA